MTLSKKQESCKEIYQSYTGVFSGGRTTNPMALAEQIEQYKRRWGKYLPTNLESIILDIGCGSGEFLIFLSDFGYINLEGIDISLDQIESAKIHGLKNVFVADAIPFLKQTEKKFDIVFSIATLHYVKDIKNGISSLFKRVDEKGFLIFNYPNVFSLYAYRKYVQDDAELRKRFSLILNQENLTSMREIQELLDRKPKNLWLELDEETSKENMCVFVRK